MNKTVMLFTFDTVAMFPKVSLTWYEDMKPERSGYLPIFPSVNWEASHVNNCSPPSCLKYRCVCVHKPSTVGYKGATYKGYKGATWGYKGATWGYKGATWGYKGATWGYKGATLCKTRLQRCHIRLQRCHI